jgi:hypothetical protein
MAFFIGIFNANAIFVLVKGVYQAKKFLNMQHFGIFLIFYTPIVLICNLYINLYRPG